MCVDVRSSDGSISPWLHGCRIINITKPAENDLKNVSKLEMVLPTGKPFKGNIDTDFFSTGDYLTLATDGYVGITKLITAKVVRSGSAYKLSTSETILDGAEIVPIGGPTSGTLKSSEVNILRNDDNAHILFDNEYYRLVKKSDTTLYYGCVSTDDTKSINKFFKILSSGKWSLLTLNVDLSNYYTKTESDGRYVKSVANKRIVYANGETGEQATFSYNASPTAWTFPIYNGAAQLSTADPTEALHAVNKKYGENNYFSKGSTELIPTTGDTISKEQLQSLGTGVYYVTNSYKLFGMTEKYWINLQVYQSSVGRMYYASLNTGELLIAQILTDADRTFIGWVKIATTEYVDNKTAVLIDSSLLGA